MADGLVEELATFFDNILVLVNESERHYGYSNTQFAEYIIERFHYSINSCNFVHEALTEAAFPVLEDYSSNLQKLIECLKGYCQQWINYEAVLESCCGVSVSYRALPEERPNTNYTGRPRYVITKDQLVYLSSLNFKWTEVAAILGVSRMTLYRYFTSCILYIMITYNFT